MLGEHGACRELRPRAKTAVCRVNGSQTTQVGMHPQVWKNSETEVCTYGLFFDISSFHSPYRVFALKPGFDLSNFDSSCILFHISRFFCSAFSVQDANRDISSNFEDCPM